MNEKAIAIAEAFMADAELKRAKKAALDKAKGEAREKRPADGGGTEGRTAKGVKYSEGSAALPPDGRVAADGRKSVSAAAPLKAAQEAEEREHAGKGIEPSAAENAAAAATVNVTVYVNSATVREEADIDRIAEKLARRIEHAAMLI